MTFTSQIRCYNFVTVGKFMISIKTYKVSEEVANFIALTNPAKVLAFRPSKESKARVSELI